MFLKTKVLIEVVFIHVNTATIVTGSLICQSQSDIESIPAEIGHIVQELVLRKYYVRLLGGGRVRTIYGNGSSKSSNVAQKLIPFKYHIALIPRYVDH